MGVAVTKGVTLKDLQESLEIAQQDLKDYLEEKTRTYREYNRASGVCERQEKRIEALKQAVESFRKASIE